MGYVDVIYEDRELIAVNKPRGKVVAEKGKPEGTLEEDVRKYLLRKFEGARGAYARARHRLDKETTGIVLLAKAKAGLKLVEAIKDHSMKRIYLAIVEGAVPDEDGTVGTPLKKGDFGHGRKVSVAVKGEGKAAVTRYHVVERYENASLLEVELETGFTHQIRVHLASIGHPLIGDKVYNPHGKIKFPRQALHAERVEFNHPVGGKRLKLKANLPKDMDALIDRLRGE
jgi:23S rRNA pseudouridine1911/1915/1917 synthase